jgi:hypothetical protein
MLWLQINSRFDTKSCLYFDICKDSYQEFKKYDDKFKTEFGLGGVLSGNVHSLVVVKQRSEHWAKAIVFGALCLEAFIYDYAAHNFSDTYARKYLDKLDLRSKWVVIPKLVTGKKFPKERQVFEHLGELIEARNELVHAKSRRMPSNDKEWERLIESYKNKKVFAKLNPYETIIEILTELRNLDDAEDKWWELKR